MNEMADLIYPSIFGIGASALFIVFLVACCVRWMRLYKLHQNAVGAEMGGFNHATAPNAWTTSNAGLASGAGVRQMEYPPAPIRMTAAVNGLPSYYTLYYGSAVSPYSNQVSYTSHHHPHQSVPFDAGVVTLPVGVSTPINVVPGGAERASSPPPYYDEPPTYDQVLAAGKSITVPKQTPANNGGQPPS